MRKTCIDCKKMKPMEDYYLSKIGTPWNGCKDCYKKKVTNTRYAKTSMQYKDYLLQAKYEVTGPNSYKKKLRFM